ncbi:TIR domain-containing protein [Myxococcota bacterium]|nr:TIR domain-containing protein [Myxococcota bacterium]
MDRSYDLFISHSWAYGDQYNRLCGLLDRAPAFPWRDYSVPRHAPLHTSGTDSELYAAIKEQIRQASCIIICAGVYASYSKWIDKEIKIATSEFRYKKPIIGVQPWENTNVSQLVRANADEIVPWRKDSIENAIKRLVG